MASQFSGVASGTAGPPAGLAPDFQMLLSLHQLNTLYPSDATNEADFVLHQTSHGNVTM